MTSASEQSPHAKVAELTGATQFSAAPVESDLSVAAIIPVYNGAQFIARAVGSVLAQTIAASEILVVDDCSTDATASIVSELASKDNRIRLLRNSSNRGPSYGRNRAIEIATAPIVAFLDADDQWLPFHLENIIGAFRQWPSASVAFGRVQIGHDPTLHRHTVVAGTSLADPMSDLLHRVSVPQSGVAVRSKRILEVGSYREDARYSEDYELWMRIALDRAQFVQVPLVTVLRTKHAGQVSEVHIGHMHDAAWDIRRRAVETRYGSVLGADAKVVDELVRAESVDIATAFNLRRRDLVLSTVKAASWIPASPQRLTATRRKVGWMWPAWRATTFLYDLLPDFTKRWWRNRNRSDRIS